jgi:cytochrome c-type biogenesis protein CcmH/NrfF
MWWVLSALVVVAVVVGMVLMSRRKPHRNRPDVHRAMHEADQKARDRQQRYGLKNPGI